MSGTEIHLYLDELEPGSVIHIHTDREPDPAPSAPRRPSVEAWTERVTAYRNGVNTLAVIDGLRALGCTLSTPHVRSPDTSPQPCLRVHAPASPGGAMLYLHPEHAAFCRKADHDRLAAMDGAEDRNSRIVVFGTTTSDGVQRALAAAAAVSGNPGRA